MGGRRRRRDRRPAATAEGERPPASARRAGARPASRRKVAAAAAAAAGGGKRKHRRRPSKKKRRWKPYFKLTWEEKKRLDERESVRAARTRAEMFARGFTVAPYNTTQFLMDEHDQEEPDLNTGARRLGKADETSEEDELDDEEQDSGSDGMGGDGMGGDGEGGEFLQRDFSETYERYHAESLQNMTKQELVREYLELEKCLSRLEDENNRLRGRLEAGRGEAADGRLRELEGELERVRARNLELQQENERYRGQRGHD
ncbi:protein HEXIM1 [Narcine bancroftii]|uniref:protein HEXIM1 n=1 Tax=Narcine bancroftii TaxID=1343680 RepID=UPI0038322312